MFEELKKSPGNKWEGNTRQDWKGWQGLDQLATQGHARI